MYVQHQPRPFMGLAVKQPSTKSFTNQLMFIYQTYGPTQLGRKERIVYYGGSSQQLHYQTYEGGEWKEIDVISYMDNLPTDMKEFEDECKDALSISALRYDDYLNSL
jgi:hypothetical protein